MSRPLLFFISTLLMISLARADEKAVEAWPPKPFKADYMIYSGDLGDAWAPTQTDRKISIDVSGQPAKEIFDSLYPDVKAICTSERGERHRRKGNVWCFFIPSSGYRCYFGFDLRTGKSIEGGEC